MVDSQDIKETVEKEFEAFDALEEKVKNICLFLYVYKSNVSDEDVAVVKEYTKTFIIYETVVPTQHSRTAIIILVDNVTHVGQYLEIENGRVISVYAYGCRLLKKIIQ